MRVHSDPGIENASTAPHQKMRSHHTTGQFANDTANKPRRSGKANIKFNSCIRVILIPSKEEYASAGLSTLLWYKEEDYAEFKASAFAEFSEVMTRDNLNRREALTLLYQPESTYDTSSMLAEKELLDSDETIISTSFPISAIQSDSAKKFKQKILNHSSEFAKNSRSIPPISPLAHMCL